MNTTTEKKDKYNTQVIDHVERNGNEEYQIARKEKDGKFFIDLRIFYIPEGTEGLFIPKKQGIWIPEELRTEVITGLVQAKDYPTPALPEGKEVVSEVVCDIALPDGDMLRVSKGRGTINAFVDLRRCYKDKKSGEFRETKKGVSILESSLDGVIEGLQKSEREPASSEA